MHSFIWLPDAMRYVNWTVILYELSAGIGLPYIQYVPPVLKGTRCAMVYM